MAAAHITRLGLLLAAAAAMSAASAEDRWVLKYTEDFNGPRLNTKLWNRIAGDPSSRADWIKNISPREDLSFVSGGVLHLRGVRNGNSAADRRRVLAGGISTQGRFNVKYGKIEARIRLQDQKGAWPAFWMMPERRDAPWPRCGEIDILERLNSDPFVYQTVHSAWTAGHPSNPPHSGKGAIKKGEWNVFSVEWSPERIVWRVNGKETHSYRNAGTGDERWPWNKPFYVIIDMQLGGSWVGEVDESTLPTEMLVDWLKFYHLERDGRRISEFTRPAPVKRKGV